MRVQPILRFLCLTCSISLPFTSGRAASAPNADEGLQTAFQRALYGVEPTPGGFVASNPAQQISARFTPTEARFQSPESSIGLCLQGYGYGERLIPAEGARLLGNGNRIEYRRGNLTEWYVNRPEGVEQGFTLAARPGLAEPGERLTIALQVSGGLEPALAPAGDAVLLESAGQVRFRYSGLRAWDATGRDLAARLEVRGRDVRLAIEDAGALYPVTVDPLVQQFKLTASDGGTNDNFGKAVAVDVDTAVIGAYKNSGHGAAYVFVRTNGAWSVQQELSATDPASGDGFGFAVAVTGDTAVIGAYNKTGTISSQGAAYVFTRNGTAWTQQAKLLAGDPGASDFFGYSVAVSADTAVIGAYSKRGLSGPAQGAAYVFTRSNATWSQQPKLTASDGASFDNFGNSVAVSGDTALIGAYAKTILPNTTQGAAYVFTRSGSTWTQQQRLVASDPISGDNFGMSVALSGNTALIGASGKASGTGAAYVFAGSGAAWSQQAKLVASDPAASDSFGYSVAAYADTAIIGAYSKNTFTGTVYEFDRYAGAWTQTSEVRSDTPTVNDDFGISVAVSAGTVIAGASANLGKGAAYVFGPSTAIVTIAATAPGSSFTASGTGCPSGIQTAFPYSFPVGVGCTVSFTSPFLNSAGDTTYTFQQWNDGNTTNPRYISAQLVNTTFTAQFGTQYLLTASASPASEGQVTGSGWYNAQANAAVVAIPNAGDKFNGFTVAPSGTVNPNGSIAMNGPKVVTGAFLPLPGSALGTLVSYKSGAQNARTWTVTLANGGPGVAYSPQISGLMLTQTYGTACTPVRLIPLAFPVGFSTIAVNGMATMSVVFDFTGCPANARFTVLITSVANSGSSVGATTLANQTM